MGSYDIQQVCLNGHQITEFYNEYPEFRRPRCNKCGAETITACPECKASIQGHFSTEGVISIKVTPVPEYCHSCGEPYPWTKEKLAQAAQISTSVNSGSPLQIVECICTRFHSVVRQLRRRHNNRGTLKVDDEYDVQDLLHALLRVHFDDIREEEWTPSYAGACARMDFLLKNEEIIIEVKMTRAGLHAKEVGNQLIEDIARYKNHPSCKTLLCFVYDPDGHIANPLSIENDLTKEQEGLTVKVFIRPTGH